MYNPELIPQSILKWVMNQAENELNAYLCEVDPYEVNGKEWPSIARGIASRCRALALAASDDAERTPWTQLAEDYEATI